MSMHKIPLTRLEESGLLAHGLDIGTPSQLSDAFRQGIAWVLSNILTDTIQLAEHNKLLRELDEAWNSHDGKERFGQLMCKVETILNGE